MEAKHADLSSLRIDRNAPFTSPGGGRRWLLVGVAAVLLIALGGAFLARGVGGAIPVHLTPAVLIAPSQANVLVVASGYVVAQRKAAVASKATGRLVYLGVVEGDRVRRGQVIARVEAGDVEAQLAQAKANLAVGQADLHDAQQSLERQRVLLAGNLSTQEAYDAADARLRRVTAGIALAQAGVDAAQVAVENTIIRAPFDGTVLTKTADVGEVVSPLTGGALSKAAVVTLADLGSLQVEVDVSEASLEQVSVGEPCEIVLDAYPDVRYAGAVAKIVPTADRAKATVQVKVAFRHYDAKVLPEMSAKVHFLPPTTSPARADTGTVIVVPAAAVAQRDGHDVVFTVSDGRAVEVPVTLGRRLGKVVAISQGLATGTAVIDSLDDRVRRGTIVNIRPSGSP